MTTMIRLSKQAKSDRLEDSKKSKNDSLRQHSFFLFDGPNSLATEETEISNPNEFTIGAGDCPNGCLDCPSNGPEQNMTENDNLPLRTRWFPEDSDNHDISTFDTTPPTEEIIFSASWDDGTEVEEEEFDKHCNSDENNTVSVQLLDKTIDETMYPTTRTSNDTTRNDPSLLLFAACTYARVFGLEYLLESHSDDDSNASSAEEWFLDWCLEHDGPPMRSTVPYGDSNTTETQSNSDDYQEDVSLEHSHSSRNEEEYPNQCLWSTIVSGLVLVFCFAFMIFYFAIETIRASKGH